MQKRNDIKVRFLSSLFTNSKVITPSKYKDALDFIFPIKSKFKDFIGATGDEQTELTKYILSLLSSKDFNSPPFFVYRKLLNVQKHEMSLITKRIRYSRDHVKHIIYLYFTGVYIFSQNSHFHNRIFKLINQQKRKFLIGKQKTGYNNIYIIFSNLWRNFCLYHDIGYPIEQIGSLSSFPHLEEDEKEFLNFLKGEILPSYKKYHHGLMIQYSIKIISHLLTILSLVHDDCQATFEKQFYLCLHDEEKNKLKASTEESILNNLKNARSYPNLVNPNNIKLISSLLPHDKIFVVFENIKNGDILFLSNYDKSYKVKFKDSNSESIFNIDNVSYYNNSNNIHIHFFFSESIKEFIEEEFTEKDKKNFKIIQEALYKTNMASGIYAHNQEILNNLSSLIFSNLIEEEYIDNDTFLNVNQTRDPFDTVNAKYTMLVPLVYDEIFKSLKKNIKKKLPQEELESCLRQAPRNIIHELLYKILRVKELGSKFNGKTSNTSYTSFFKTLVNKDSLYKDVIKELKQNLLPEIEDKKEISTALIELCSTLTEKLRKDYETAYGGSPLFQEIEKWDDDNCIKVNELYKTLETNEFVKKIKLDNIEDIISKVENYGPPWKNDHGFTSAIYYLATAEFNYNFIKTMSDGVYAFNNLAFFTNEAHSNDELLDKILFEASICFPAIFYHNYYPEHTVNDKDFRNNYNFSPFTYLATLSDVLQNWGREVNYNPGITNLHSFKPDNFYSIEFDNNKIILYINDKYADEKDVCKLKKDFESFLFAFDAILEIRLSQFD